MKKLILLTEIRRDIYKNSPRRHKLNHKNQLKFVSSVILSSAVCVSADLF